MRHATGPVLSLSVHQRGDQRIAQHAACISGGGRTVCVQEKPLRAQQSRAVYYRVVVVLRALTMTFWRDLCQGRCHTHAAAAGRTVFYDDNRASALARA